MKTPFRASFEACARFQEATLGHLGFFSAATFERRTLVPENAPREREGTPKSYIYNLIYILYYVSYLYYI